MSYRELVTDFEAFIENKIRQRGVKYEVILVLILGALSSPGLYYLGEEVLDLTDSDEMVFVVTGIIVRPVLILLLLWVVYSMLFYFVGNHLGGHGSIRGIFKGTAWAMIPLGLANLAQSAAFWWTYQDFDIEGNLDGFGPAEQMDSVLYAGITEPAILASLAILILTLVWSGWLMIYTVEQAKNLPRETAMKLVAVPIAAHILLIIWAVIQGSYNFATLI